MKVRLHSNEKSAAEATDATIQALQYGTCLERDADWNIVFDKEGLATVIGGSGFIAWALSQQGYVKEVIQ